MQVRHESDAGDTQIIATEVTVANSFLTKARGLMGRSNVPEDFALVFEFDGVGRRSIHMIGVRTPIDVIWLVEERVNRVETLDPWRGLGFAEADTVIELAPGAAAAVEPGDRVWVATEGNNRL